VLSPDRDVVPDARPVVSFRDDDEPGFLAEIERRALARVALRRRGVDHGLVAELDPHGLLPPRPRRRRREAIRSERWCAARPIALPGVAEGAARAARGASGLARRLAHPESLAAWLHERSGSALRLDASPAELFDPERDVVRARVLAPGIAPADDVWIKVGRLSTFAGDRSLRLRISFGREGKDDASADERRHLLVAELAARVVPGAAELAGEAELRAALERLCARPVLLTQPIAYWNAPEGGARFHHDAFAQGGQLGVLFAQLAGRTAWLALSIEDLGARVRELLEALAEGELPWLRDALEPRAPLSELAALAAGRASLLAELALPDCGRFEALVNAPEATGYLADAGHALILGPGDALLLPNHGLERTAMHSVFCASRETTYGLSLAIRSAAGPG
jgi:hypothetical protein